MPKLFCPCRSRTSGLRGMALSMQPSFSGLTGTLWTFRSSNMSGTSYSSGCSLGLKSVRPWVPPNTRVPSESLQEARS